VEGTGLKKLCRDGSELRRLKQLEDEKRRLRGLVADLTLDEHILQEVMRKSPKAAGRRQLTHQITE
jgi:hypothetical protein